MIQYRFYSLIICICLSLNVFSSDSLKLFKQKKIILTTTSTVVTTGSIIYLNKVWYQQYYTSAFHTFNDTEEWFQLDKCGHAFTTYQTGRLMMQAMEGAGYSIKKAIVVGGLSGFAYMGVIELMDGYSSGWGFSWSDVGANALGSGLLIAQKICWKEQRITLKYSFLTSTYANYNPNLLGKSLTTQVLKDYNGQTYWLSINPASFIKQNNHFPKWLNIAIGYGANGMIGARDNAILNNNINGNSINFKRYRQAYLSLDVDFSRIKTNSKILKTLFNTINILKFPFPNAEWSNGELKFNYY